MKNTDLEALKSGRAADRELLFGLSFFALLWLAIGAAVYQSIPVIGCLNDFGADKKAVCTKALERSFIPASLQLQVREKLVETLMAAESFDEALAQIGAQEKHSPLGSVLLLQRANAFWKLEKRDEAAKDFRAVLALDPSHQDAAADLVRLLIDSSKLDEARTAAAGFVAANPNSSVLISWQGWVEYLSDNTEKAIAFYERAAVISPQDSYLHQDMGYIFNAAGEYDKAIASYTKAIALWPTDATLLNRRAEVYTKLEQHSLAQTDHLNALEENRDLDTLINLGRSFTDSKNYAEAAPLFDEAIAQSNTSEWAYASKARMYFRQNRLENVRATIAALRKAVPDSTHAISWQATLDDEEGRDDAALAGYKQVLETWDDDFNTMIDTGHLLVDLSRASEALPYLDKAIVISPKTDYAYTARARANVALRNWPAVLADAEMAISLKPNSAMGFARRAKAAAELGLQAKAIASYADATRLDPDLAWVRRGQLDYLMANNLMNEAKDALKLVRAATPHSVLYLEYEAILQQRGVTMP